MAYQLEKWIWTENDFDQMGWHDACIYAVQFGKDLSFDIDYIFEWVQTDEDGLFSFEIAPATLVFLEPTGVLFNIEFLLNQTLEIEDLHRRVTESGVTEWCLETRQGSMTIRTNSFRQIIRRPPTRQTGQQLLPEERGEPSFSFVPDTAYVVSEEVSRIKAADFILREKAEELRRLRRRLMLLLEQRSAGVLEVKRYLLEKRKLEFSIAHLQVELQATDWQDVI